MQKHLLRNAYFYSLTAAGVLGIAGTLTGILSSRTLGPIGRGQLTALLLLPGLIGRISNLGMLQAIGYLDSPARGSAKPVAGAALLAALAIGCGFALCLIPLLSLLVPSLPRDMLRPAAVCLAFIPLNFVFTALLGAELAAGHFRSYNLLQAATGVGQLVLMLMFWRMGMASAASYALAVVMALFAVLLLEARTLARMLWLEELTRGALKQVLAKSWEFTLPELAGLALLRCDVLLLARLVSSEALGFYTVALAIAFGQALAASPLSQVCFHATSSASDRIAGTEALARQFRLLHVLFLALAGIIIAITPIIISVAFGPRFTASIPAARILVLSMAVWSCSQMLEGGLRGLNLARLGSWGNLLGLVLLLASAPRLVQTFGIKGMAVAMLVAQSASLGAKLLLLRSATGCAARNFWALNRESISELAAAATLKGRGFLALGVR